MSEKEVITLEKYFTTLLDERDKRIEQRFDAMEKAVIKAEVAHEKRLENMNEFRGQLMDQSKTFVPRMEFEIIAKKVEKIENLKQGGTNAWIIIVAGASVLIAFFMLALKLLGK
jgi:hypothetical protein